MKNNKMLMQEAKEMENAVGVFAKDCKCEMVFDQENSHHGELVVFIKGRKFTFDSVKHFVDFAMGLL